MTTIKDYLTMDIAGIRFGVSGEYDPADFSTGHHGSFTVYFCWVESDPKQTNLKSVLDDYFIDLMENEGFVDSATSQRESREDALADRVRGAGEVA